MRTTNDTDDVDIVMRRSNKKARMESRSVGKALGGAWPGMEGLEGVKRRLSLGGGGISGGGATSSSGGAEVGTKAASMPRPVVDAGSPFM